MSFEIPTINWDSSRIIILWADDWWDGIVSGVATFDGRRIYFDCISEEDNGDRKFAFYDVPLEVWEQIDEQHRDFQKYVGTHCDYVQTEYGRLMLTDNVRPQSEHHKFYDKWLDKKIKMDEKWQIAVVNSVTEV